MRAFKDNKSRWALLYADIEMEMQNYPLAQRKFARLLNVPAIKSNREQAAYCSFALGIAYRMQRKDDQAAQYLDLFLPGKPFAGTTVAPRALTVWANNLAQNVQQTARMEKGLAIYRYIFTAFPNTEEGDNAWFKWGVFTGACGQYTVALEHLKQYPKKYPNGKHLPQLQYMLDVFTKSAQENH